MKRDVRILTLGDPLTVRRLPTNAIAISEGSGFDEAAIYLTDQETRDLAKALTSIVEDAAR